MINTVDTDQQMHEYFLNIKKIAIKILKPNL